MEELRSELMKVVKRLSEKENATPEDMKSLVRVAKIVSSLIQEHPVSEMGKSMTNPF